MTKILFIFFFLLIQMGGCQMSDTASSANAQTAQETNNRDQVKILKHAEDNFSLAENQVAIKEITSKELPVGVKYYYLEKKSSYGNLFYNYFVYNDKLFCSKIEGDFERFLKETAFLTKKNLSSTQFWNSFQQLKFNYRDAMLIDEKLISNPYDILKPLANQLSPPKLEYQDNSAKFTFNMVDTNDEIIRQYLVNVSSDYQTSVEYTDLKKK